MAMPDRVQLISLSQYEATQRALRWSRLTLLSNILADINRRSSLLQTG